MIDLHCHLLPGVDDGPATMEEALALARLSVEDGITHAVLTPHIHPGRYENTRTTLEAPLEAFRNMLQAEGIALQLRLGGEVRVSMESLELLLADDIPHLGELDGERVVLFEFPHQNIPAGSTQFFRKALDLGIRPLIAHPERNKSVMERPERIRPFVEMGCLLQLTASSVTGYFGSQAQRLATGMIDDETAWVVGSDAHNTTHRPPLMKRCREILHQRYGEETAELMTRKRGMQMLGVSPA